MFPTAMEILREPQFLAALLGALIGGAFTLVGAVLAHWLERLAAAADERATRESSALLDFIEWCEATADRRSYARGDYAYFKDPVEWLIRHQPQGVLDSGVVGVRVELFGPEVVKRPLRLAGSALARARNAEFWDEEPKDVAKAARWADVFIERARLIAQDALRGDARALSGARTELDARIAEFQTDKEPPGA